MTYEVRMAATAEDDVRDIFWYVTDELGEPGAAKRLIRRIRKAVEGLSTFPERNRIADREPWRSRNMRHTVVGNYVMFYVVDSAEATVNVVRIVYGGRDVWAQLSRLLGQE